MDIRVSVLRSLLVHEAAAVSKHRHGDASTDRPWLSLTRMMPRAREREGEKEQLERERERQGERDTEGKSG